MSAPEETFIIPLPGAVQEAPRPPTPGELRSMRITFKDARDKWKIDGMKAYYLHSESGYLYTWDQPSGMLYEYAPSTGQCQAVWTSACPQLNAELWTVLPLPPTDPASLQASQLESGEVPNCDVYINLAVAHEAGHHVPADVIKTATEEFYGRFQFTQQAKTRLAFLSPAGQAYVIQNFRGDGRRDDSICLADYVSTLQRQRPPPWGNSACSLRVEATGAIIGRCCADLDALCRDDPPERLSQAHCKIKSEDRRFFICDLNTTKEGTLLDGFALNDDWIGPLKNGSLLTIGPLRIRITLSDLAKERPKRKKAEKQVAEGEAGSDDGGPEDAEWKRKVFQKTDEWKKAEQKKRQELYKDRADERRRRAAPEAGSIAIDTLINKYDQIRAAETAAEAAEDGRIEMPMQEAHREAHMNVDGSFMGHGDMERAGIGFGSSSSASLIPNVLDPNNLSRGDSSKLKTQLRFNQAHGSG